MIQLAEKYIFAIHEMAETTFRTMVVVGSRILPVDLELSNPALEERPQGKIFLFHIPYIIYIILLFLFSSFCIFNSHLQS